MQLFRLWKRSRNLSCWLYQSLPSLNVSPNLCLLYIQILYSHQQKWACTMRVRVKEGYWESWGEGVVWGNRRCSMKHWEGIETRTNIFACDCTRPCMEYTTTLLNRLETKAFRLITPPVWHNTLKSLFLYLAERLHHVASFHYYSR